MKYNKYLFFKLNLLNKMIFENKEKKTEKTKQNYYNNYYLSINNTSREKFWYEQCDEIDFYKKPSLDNILDKSNPPFYLWFPDSELNMCYNCIDRHIKNNLENNNAIIFESYYIYKK